MKVICQLLVLMNFVFQELKILLQPMNLELRKGKKRKVLQWKYILLSLFLQCNFYLQSTIRHLSLNF